MSSNGEIPSSNLVTVQGTMKLETSTAAAYNAMKAAAATAGSPISITSPAGAYRSLTMQQDMHDNPQNYGILPGVTLAAVGSSTHGWGTAVDIYQNNSWVVDNHAEYGFSREFGASDPNHYRYIGGGSSASNPQLEEEEDMHIIYVARTGYTDADDPFYMLLPDGTYRVITRTEFYLRRKNPYDPTGAVKKVNEVDLATLNELLTHFTLIPDPA